MTELSETAPTTSRNEVLLATEATFGGAVAEGVLPRAAILRLAGLYGPGRHSILDRLCEGETTFPGSGEYYLNLIHRDDAARAVESLVKQWSGSGLEVFNCADGEPALKAVVAQWAAREMGLPPPLFRPEEVSARDRRRATRDGVVPHRRICADKLRNTTGWTPRYENFRAGYRELLAESETGEAS